MIAKLVRAVGLFGVLLAVAPPAAPGATPKEIDRAIKGGTDALKARYGRAGAPGSGEHGIGGTCLVGLALLEAGTPGNDAAVKAITDLVRDASYKVNSTYQVSLCLMYLDRYGDPADVPLIQMLSARLIAGQTTSGGWLYDTVAAIPAADEALLRKSFKENQLVAGGAGAPPRLHPAVAEYGKALMAARNQNEAGGDNSNTQFAVIAVWMSRKHGAPVDNTLDMIEKRFMATQDVRSGNWAYSDGSGSGSPSMYCSGLLGMATGLARREERRLKTDPPPKPKPDAPAKPDKPGDPFYNPPAGTPLPKAPVPARPADARDLVVQRAFAGLGLTMVDQIRNGMGLLTANSTHGNGDLYFLWSLERVGVIYGVDKIGGIDWHDAGSTVIVRSQGADGTWTVGSYGAEVNTSLAVLFLCRSNLARDLSSKVQKDPTSTEMRAGSGPSAIDLLPNRPATPVATPLPVINLPNPTGDAAIAQASLMLKASQSDWGKLLAAARDAKGTTNTRALVVTATNADGDRKAAAREALAERLCRMTAATLRAMLKTDEAELRRAAALACAMKDDKDHIPDLIDALGDKDASVMRAAKAGLKSLTGKAFATADEWREWYAKEKK